MTNETLLQTLIAVNLAVSIIGGGILVKWLVRHIRALEGTVKAQGETLATVTGLNNTLVNVFKAVDPDRWAKEVTIHKELADKKAAAIVEEAERKFREERTALSGQTVEAVQRMGDLYKEALDMALRFMPWVPKSHRLVVIAEANLTDREKKTLTDLATENADWSALGQWWSRGAELGDVSRLVGQGGYIAAAQKLAREDNPSSEK